MGFLFGCAISRCVNSAQAGYFGEHILVGLGETMVSPIKRGICKSNTSENLGQGIQVFLNLYYMPIKMRRVSKLSVDISSDPEQIHGFSTFHQPIFRISACSSLSHHHASVYTICLTCDISQTSNSLIVALGGFHTPMLPLGVAKTTLYYLTSRCFIHVTQIFHQTTHKLPFAVKLGSLLKGFFTQT